MSRFRNTVLALACLLTGSACNDHMDPTAPLDATAGKPSLSSSAYNPLTRSVVFDYHVDIFGTVPDRAPFTFTVPERVTTITIDAYGAEGGDGRAISGQSSGGSGGKGGRALTTIPVTPGEQLTIRVGSQGSTGMTGFGGGGIPVFAYNGGGLGGSGSGGIVGGDGGGASDVRRGETILVVAGGGGGGGGCVPGVDGGAGGELGVSGAAGSGANPGVAGGLGGAGGQGTGGTSSTGTAQSGSSGSPGQGGRGGSNATCDGGGGGGGAMGGGGGAAGPNDFGYGGGGGGGGSSSGPTGTVFETGAQSGDGRVVISYAPNYPPEMTFTPGAALDVDLGETATMSGTFIDIEGDQVNLHASVGHIDLIGPGLWTWFYRPTAAGSSEVTFTATDEFGPFTRSFPLRVFNPMSASNDGPGNVGGAVTISVPITPVEYDNNPNTTFAFYCDDRNLTTPVAQDRVTTAQCTYGQDGEYRAVVLLIGGSQGDYRGRTTVRVGNVAPVITSVTGPTGVPEGQGAFFKASVTDANGDALTYTWSFGDGTTEQGSNLAHVYADNGTYDVTLTVDDGHGGTASRNLTATILNADPSAFLSPVGPVNSDAAFDLTISNALDAPGDMATLQYAFSCNGTDWSEFGSSPRATCPAPGAVSSLQVRGRVRDKDGGVGTFTRTVTVIQVNRAPQIAAGSFANGISGNEGVAVAFTASATDPDNDALTFAWTFGDGATGAGQQASHVYADDADYTATLTVTDAHGATDNVTFAVRIANVAPAGILIAPTHLNEGASVSLAVQFVQDVGADMGSLRYAFSCDGATWGAFSNATSATCRPESFGEITVGARIMDKDGGVTEHRQQVVLHNVAPFVAPIANAEVMAGEMYTGEGFFSDLANDAPYTVSVVYGDGSAAESPAYAGVSANRYRFVVSHRYMTAGVYTLSATVKDKGGMGGAVTGASAIITVLNAAQTTARLTVMVNGMAVGGTLAPNEAKQLTDAVENAAKQMEKGNTNAASSHLDGFVKKVEALVKKGRLSATAAQALTEYALRIQRSL